MRPSRPSLPFLVLAVVAAGACGSTSSVQPSPVAKHVNLSFVYANRSLNATQEMVMGAKAAADGSPGVSFSDIAPPTSTIDESVELGLFKGAVKTAADGVAVPTSTPGVFSQALQEARAAGVPLVAVDTPPPPSTGVETFIGNSNYEVGQLLGTEMLKVIPAGATGKVVVGTGIPGFSVLTQRLTGMLQVIRQQRPNVQIIGPFNSHLVPKDNLDAWTAEVNQYPDALAYLAPSEGDAVSLAQIERQTGRHLMVGACNLASAALQAVREGLVYALVSPEQWLKGYLAIKLLARRAQQGTPLPQGWWNPGALVVTSANADEIIAREQDAASKKRWFEPRAARQVANPSHYFKPISAAT